MSKLAAEEEKRKKRGSDPRRSFAMDVEGAEFKILRLKSW